MATRRTQSRSYRWWWYLNLVLIHRFSIVGVGKLELQRKQTKGGLEMGHPFKIDNPKFIILMISTTVTINPAPDIINSLTILRLTLGSGLSK